MPIGKFPANTLKQAKEENRWLYEGSKVVEKRMTSLALVVNVGYASRRGRIVRKILTKTIGFTEVFKKCMIFFLEIFIVSNIIYLGALEFMIDHRISPMILGFRYIDFLGWSFPPLFPIFFNLTYSFAIARLKASGIMCIEPPKTVESTNLKVMCFDKTGTLT